MLFSKTEQKKLPVSEMKKRLTNELTDQLINYNDKDNVVELEMTM